MLRYPIGAVLDVTPGVPHIEIDQDVGQGRPKLVQQLKNLRLRTAKVATTKCTAMNLPKRGIIPCVDAREIHSHA